MSTKAEVIRLLEENKNEYVSGNFIAQELGISRNAIWKAINALEKEGYLIEAVPRLGYRLKKENDVVSQQGILKYLEDWDGASKEFDVRPTVTSTNDLVREAATAGAGEGLAVVAMEQTKGRGRRGRSFYSPSGTGIYFSYLLRPDMVQKEAAHITTMAGVAVAMALEEYGVENPGIKWVNDIYIDERKVCGIISEATYSIETGGIDFVILGIGINIYSPEGGFPEEIANKAGSIFGDEHMEDARNRICALVYKHFFNIYKENNYAKVLEEYRSRCFILGRNITVLKLEGECPAKAIGLDAECGLMVEYEDGTVETLSSGEVSLRI